MAVFNSAVSVTACLTLGDNLSVAGKIFTTAGTALLLTDRMTQQFRLEVRPVCLFSALLACVLQYLTLTDPADSCVLLYEECWPLDLRRGDSDGWCVD